MTDDPLEHEDVLVTVTVRHVTTGEVGTRTIHAPVDAAPTVSEALALASSDASEQLVSQLEQRGGS